MNVKTGHREVRLPALSATMEEATLLSWLVSPGDEVREGQPLAEVSTDKVDMELESPFTGTVVKLLVEPGTSVPLGGALAIIATDDDDLLGGLALDHGPDDTSGKQTHPTDDGSASSGTTTTSPTLSSPTSPGIVPASPPARKLARELGIDLAQVIPTGNRGEVTPADVRAYHNRFQAGQVRTGGSTEERTTEVSPRNVQQPSVGEKDHGGADNAKRLAIRRATATVMERSAVIPQFTLYRTLKLDRAALKKGGRSWTTEFVRAVAGALRRHPELNTSWDPYRRQTVPFDGVRVGVAVDRPGVGLIVGTIADPDADDPDEIDREIRALVDRARTGKLRPEDLAQPSITVSNLGGLGVDRFNALLFPPQAAILSVGSVLLRPVATSEGALMTALTCDVGLTVDHRVADGADGARYLETFVALVEARY